MDGPIQSLEELPLAPRQFHLAAYAVNKALDDLQIEHAFTKDYFEMLMPGMENKVDIISVEVVTELSPNAVNYKLMNHNKKFLITYDNDDATKEMNVYYMLDDQERKYTVKVERNGKKQEEEWTCERDRVLIETLQARKNGSRSQLANTIWVNTGVPNPSLLPCVE